MRLVNGGWISLVSSSRARMSKSLALWFTAQRSLGLVSEAPEKRIADETGALSELLLHFLAYYSSSSRTRTLSSGSHGSTWWLP
jgi:hypothetical protein